MDVGRMDNSCRWVAVGVDVAEARRGLDLVALDRDRQIVECRRRLTVDGTLEIVGRLRPRVVCIDSPSGWSTRGSSRLAERQLAAIGIQSYRTPADPRDHPFYRWMRVGHALYGALSDGYPLYRGGAVERTAAEVFPHATACLLADQLPAAGRRYAFRRQVLASHRVPEQQLRGADQVDAALGALTGLIALDDGHTVVGDPAEGVILLPIRAVPQERLGRGEPEPGANQEPRSPQEPRGPRPAARSRGRRGETVQIGYVNPNGQRVIEATGLPGTDHGQSIYVLHCERCGMEYGNNGSGNFNRRCPGCQRGAPGLPYR